MPESYDVIVVGGGCNGTGIARDCAMRGMKTLLLEKNDFSSGTTGASSGMIHGGPRYLLSETKTTRSSSQDAGYIRQIAPHLVFRIPFLHPVLHRGSRRPLHGQSPMEPPPQRPFGAGFSDWIRLTLVEAFFHAYDRFSALKGGKRHTRLTAAEARELEPDLTPDVVGAVTFDEWGIQTERLCVGNALAAANHGAVVKNHTEVKRILRDDCHLTGLVARDLLTGEEFEYRCRILCNATGPWVPELARLAGVSIKLRPAKGIHLVLDRRITNVAVTSQCIDGRQIFINPHENTTLLGTTDDDYYGDLDEIPVTEDEVEYLLQGMERSYPEIRNARVISTTRGVRPTLFGQDVYEDELSRDHRIFDHETEDGLQGFISLAGGKLAAFRQMAEETTDLIAKKLAVQTTCQTHVVPLPGGDRLPDPNEIARRYQVSPWVAGQLIGRHGSLVDTILESVVKQPGERAVICPCEPVTQAEVRYVVRHEWAATLCDIRRRTRLGAGPCQGGQCLLPAVATLCEERSVDPLEQLMTFLQESWKARLPILKGVQLAQEEMLQMTYAGVLGLGS